MSVIDKNVIDGMAFDEKENTLIMEIYDHLSSEDMDEYEHLMMLQDKLNTYLDFFESGQYLDSYPGIIVKEVSLNIHFKYDITDNFTKFLDFVTNKLADSIFNVYVYVK